VSKTVIEPRVEAVMVALAEVMMQIFIDQKSSNSTPGADETEPKILTYRVQ